MISDDDLLLYYYRDGLDATERARVGAALAENPELAQRYLKLIARLDAVAAIPEVPVPDAVKQRWAATIAQAASQSQVARLKPRARPFFDGRWLAAAAIVLVAVVSVFEITRQTPVTQPPTVQNTPTPGSAYERGLKTHLASTEQQLASFESATPEERSKLVATIIEQNRIYALAAERAGEPQLARVLRAFSPILEDLQKGGTNPTASVSQLAFELRVMQGRLGAGPASKTQSTTL